MSIANHCLPVNEEKMCNSTHSHDTNDDIEHNWGSYCLNFNFYSPSDLTRYYTLKCQEKTY